MSVSVLASTAQGTSTGRSPLTLLGTTVSMLAELSEVVMTAQPSTPASVVPAVRAPLPRPLLRRCYTPKRFRPKNATSAKRRTQSRNRGIHAQDNSILLLASLHSVVLYAVLQGAYGSYRAGVAADTIQRACNLPLSRSTLGRCDHFLPSWPRGTSDPTKQLHIYQMRFSGDMIRNWDSTVTINHSRASQNQKIGRNRKVCSLCV